ncbi:MAG: SH3 domain-containing protein [Clostridia bacterium]|nr:SH3 domain-containing protein [Clostridia bacterium]
MKVRLFVRILSLLICCLALFGGVCPARAEGCQIAGQGILDFALVQGTSRVNLRKGPGTQYDVLAAVDEYTWVGLTARQGDWYVIYVPALRQSGYMSVNYLKLGEDASPVISTGGVVKNPVATQFLNLRAYPSYDAQVLGIFYNGTPFTLLSDPGSGWLQVLVGQQVGYFRKEFVQLSAASGQNIYYIQSPNSGGVNLRNAPYLNGSAVLSQYPAGTRVSVLLSSPKSGAYWKVAVNGVTGYMDSRYLVRSSNTSGGSAASSGSGASHAAKPKTQGSATVSNPKATQYLNLRAQPSTTAKVVAQYRNGVRFEVIQAGETWTKVYGSATGNIGYFMTRYLHLSGASTQKTVSNGTSYVNLRSAPSKASGQVYIRVPSGASITVLIPGDEWTKVRYGGTEGYMMTCFLK